MIRASHGGPVRVPTQIKPTRRSGLSHRRVSFPSRRSSGRDKSRCGQHCPLNGSNGRDLNLPIISGILTASRRSWSDERQTPSVRTRRSARTDNRQLIWWTGWPDRRATDAAAPPRYGHGLPRSSARSTALRGIGSAPYLAPLSRGRRRRLWSSHGISGDPCAGAGDRRLSMSRGTSSSL
jgi:hypothetical protein